MLKQILFGILGLCFIGCRGFDDDFVVHSRRLVADPMEDAEASAKSCTCLPLPGEYEVNVEFTRADGTLFTFPFTERCSTSWLDPTPLIPRRVYDIAVNDAGVVTHFYTLRVPEKDRFRLPSYLRIRDLTGPTVLLLDHDSVRVTPIPTTVQLSDAAALVAEAHKQWYASRKLCNEKWHHWNLPHRE